MSNGAQAGIAVPGPQQLGKRALSLGAAGAFDYAIQFLLPVVLVRCLDASAFGQYRLLWLEVGTVMALVTMAMPGSLYYFLPRAEGATKRLYINQTLVFMAAVGSIAAWAVSGWDPLLPQKLRALASGELVVPAFVLVWVIATVLDLLPSADERIEWQAKATVALAIARATALCLAAALTRELASVLLALLVFALFKLALLAHYVSAHHRLRGPLLRRTALAGQIRLAAPFWVSGALYSLRAQVDQWVAAALFPLGLFASFSIAAVLGTLMNLFRQSVNYAFLPSMSRLEAGGDIAGMLALNSRANVMVGALVFPLLAVAFVFAREIVAVVYTGAYAAAAPVMRVYAIGLAALVLELASITLLLRQGTFVMALNFVNLLAAAALNWFAASHFGLAGAAVGSVVAIYIDRIATLRRIARCTGMRLRQLQQWRELGLLLLFAVLAGAFTGGVMVRLLAHSDALMRIGVGAPLLLVAYAAMVAPTDIGRGWLAALRRS